MTTTARTIAANARRITVLLGACLGMLVVPERIAAQDSSLRLTQRPGSTVRLNGTTTIRAKWSCTGDQPDASMELDTRRNEADALLNAIARADGVAPGAVRRITLRVKAADLKCGNGLETKALRRAIGGQDVIGEFRVASGAAATSSQVRVAGQLTVAGVTREVVLDVATRWMPDGTVRASGAMPLNLSDFNIEPPRVLLSAVRAVDRLTVSFDLLLAVAEPANASIVARRTGAASGR